MVPRLRAAAAEMTQTPEGEPWSTGTRGIGLGGKDSSPDVKGYGCLFLAFMLMKFWNRSSRWPIWDKYTQTHIDVYLSLYTQMYTLPLDKIMV